MKKYLLGIGIFSLICFVASLIVNIVYGVYTFKFMDDVNKALYIFQIFEFGIIGPSTGILFIVVKKHDDLIDGLISFGRKKKFNHIGIEVKSYVFSVRNCNEKVLILNDKDCFSLNSIYSVNRVDNVITIVNSANMYTFFFSGKEEAKTVYETLSLDLDLN